MAPRRIHVSSEEEDFESEDEIDELADPKPGPSVRPTTTRTAAAASINTAQSAPAKSVASGIASLNPSDMEDDSEDEEDEVDDDDGEEEGEDEEEDGDDEEEDEGADSDDMDMDSEDAGTRAPSVSASPAATARPTGPVKIKLKLGGAGLPSAVTTMGSPGTRVSKGKGTAAKSKAKGKGKRKASDLDQEDDLEDDEEGSASEAGGGLKTARQRGGDVEMLSLPLQQTNKKVRTEAELALERSEKSRKRKNQSDRKLEEEKTETINRLLKKQVGKQRTRKSTPGGDEGGEGEATPQPPPPPTMYRYISSIRDGDYRASISVPTNVVQESVTWAKEPKYPPPRPPPKTRLLRAGPA